MTKQLRETHHIPALHSTDAIGSFALQLFWEEWEPGKVGWVDFKLFEVTGYDTADPSKFYYGSGGTGGALSLDEAEIVAEGFVKWDGCMQFKMAAVHVDHREDLENLFHGIREARRLCAKAMSWSADLAGEYDL